MWESLDYALQTFEVSRDKNSITWSAMIIGFAQSGHSEKALKLFATMLLSGFRSSEFTFAGVLNACSNIGDVWEGKQVHDFLLKLGFESQIYIMTALVDMYAKCGSIVDAKKVSIACKSLTLWTSMIGEYVQNGHNEEARNLYGKMEMGGIFPNELTMASVLKACFSLAALEQGKQLHARTVKYGLSLEVPIENADYVCQVWVLEDGTLVFRRMPKRDAVSWNAMISGLSQIGCGKKLLSSSKRCTR